MEQRNFWESKSQIRVTEDSILSLQIQMDNCPSEVNGQALASTKSSLHNLLHAEETHWKL